MPCDTRLKRNQTLQQRAAEVRAVVDKLNRALVSGSVTAIVNAQGAVAFKGVTEADRDGVTDNCLYRRIMATGSTAAKLALQRAEMLAGRSVNRAVVNQGVHSHDGGKTWHQHKG